MSETSEKARATRERNRKARAAQRAAREAEEKQDRALVLEALRAVLRDSEATTEQRLFAVAVLDNMKYYHFVPRNVKQPRADSDEVIADFARRLEELNGAENPAP